MDDLMPNNVSPVVHFHNPTYSEMTYNASITTKKWFQKLKTQSSLSCHSFL